MKNKLYALGDEVRYKYYRNKISSLIRISKKNYYSDYFETNLSNIKKTWTGINELLFRRKKNLKTIIAIKDPNNMNKVVMAPHIFLTLLINILHPLGVNSHVRFLLLNIILILLTKTCLNHFSTINIWVC